MINSEGSSLQSFLKDVSCLMRRISSCLRFLSFSCQNGMSRQSTWSFHHSANLFQPWKATVPYAAQGTNSPARNGSASLLICWYLCLPLCSPWFVYGWQGKCLPPGLATAAFQGEVLTGGKPLTPGRLAVPEARRKDNTLQDSFVAIIYERIIIAMINPFTLNKLLLVLFLPILV